MKTKDERTMGLVVDWRDAVIRNDPTPEGLLIAMGTIYSVMEEMAGEEGKRELAINFAKAVETAREL